MNPISKNPILSDNNLIMDQQQEGSVSVPVVPVSVVPVPVVPVPDSVVPVPGVPEEQKDEERKEDRPRYLWHGKHAFAGAVQVYVERLKEALANALNFLGRHPGIKVAWLKLPMFEKIYVPCMDQNGNVKEFPFDFHEAHYGLWHRDGRKARNFWHRFERMWTLIGQEGKVPGGDGKGFGGTACSPFRDAQRVMLNMGLYLTDESNFKVDEKTGKSFLGIDIKLQREPPMSGPRRDLGHSFGFIPGLGPARINGSMDAEQSVAAVPQSVVAVSDPQPMTEQKRVNRNGSEKRHAKKVAQQGADDIPDQGKGQWGQGKGRGGRGKGQGGRGGRGKGGQSKGWGD